MRIASDRRRFVQRGAAWLSAAPAVLRATAALGLPVLAPRPAGAGEEAHGFEEVVARARRLAEAPYAPAEPVLAPPFDELSAERYAGIEPDPAAQVDLGGVAFEPLPPGYVYRDPVRLALVAEGRARWLAFEPRLFRYDPAHFETIPEVEAAGDMAFSGFRLRHGAGGPEPEVFLAFRGASQFRGRHRGGGWGASARGLAIATASTAGEEVPRFTHAWVHAAEAGVVRIHALLDSPSLAGAYAFEVEAGAETAVTVGCRLFPRADIAGVGIAPLSSMHLFSAGARSGVDDVRDAVHDSDGLQMVTGRGERLWRPLTNPGTLQLSGFVDDGPRGFGLAQRQRAYAGFGDPDAGFERRPSLWVEPLGDWGRGQVVLVEIPLPSEVNDNIVAFWRPDAALAAGAEHAFAYRLSWAALPPDAAPLARVVATATGAGGEGVRRFAVDFDRSAAPPGEQKPVLTVSRGSFHGLRLVATPEPARVRVEFNFVPDGAELSEFRLVLHGADGGPASETWLYRWTAS